MCPFVSCVLLDIGDAMLDVFRCPQLRYVGTTAMGGYFPQYSHVRLSSRCYPCL